MFMSAWLTRLLLTSAFVVSLTCAVMPQASSEELFVPVNDVSFTIVCERRAYKIGEQVRIDYQVKNVSGKALFVPRGEWSATCPPSPKVWAWFENSTGRHFIGGYAGSCGAMRLGVSERMKKEALLLRPGEKYHDYILLDTTTFKNDLVPGRYRIEAALYGWRDAEFDDTEKSELRALRHPFLRGDAAASTAILLRK